MVRHHFSLVQHHRLRHIDLGFPLRTSWRLKNQLIKLMPLLACDQITEIYFGRTNIPIDMQTTYLITKEGSGVSLCYRARSLSAGGQPARSSYFTTDDEGTEEAIEYLHERAVAQITHIRAQKLRFPNLTSIKEKDLGFFTPDFNFPY